MKQNPNGQAKPDEPLVGPGQDPDKVLANIRLAGVGCYKEETAVEKKEKRRLLKNIFLSDRKPPNPRLTRVRRSEKT